MTELTTFKPSNLMEAIKLAEMMSSAKLVAAALQKSPSDCLMVIEQAMRWGMSPFAVAQSVSVIGGKLMFEGKLVAAVVNANGDLSERLSYAYEGAGENRKITVSGKVRSEAKARTIEVVYKDAKTTNKVWQTQPDQQLMYHGVRVWARRHAPELMLGVYSPEEFDDQPTQTVATATGFTIVEQPKITAPAPTTAPVAPPEKPAVVVHPPAPLPLNDKGEFKPHAIKVPVLEDGSGSDWMQWGKSYASAVAATTSVKDIDAWTIVNAKAMTECFSAAPKIHELLTVRLNDRRAFFHDATQKGAA